MRRPSQLPTTRDTCSGSTCAGRRTAQTQRVEHRDVLSRCRRASRISASVVSSEPEQSFTAGFADARQGSATCRVQAARRAVRNSTTVLVRPAPQRPPATTGCTAPRSARLQSATDSVAHPLAHAVPWPDTPTITGSGVVRPVRCASSRIVASTRIPFGCVERGEIRGRVPPVRHGHNGARVRATRSTPRHSQTA